MNPSDLDELMLRDLLELQKVGITQVIVLHDITCPRLKNGECNCTPEYQLVPPKERQQ